MNELDNTPGREMKLEVPVPGPASSAAQGSRSRLSLLHMLKRLFTFAERLLVANTFSPVFLRGQWAYPILGYLVAVVLQVVTVVGVLALVRIYPSFQFSGIPFVLVVLLVALGWGTGPGLLATAMGMALLVCFVLPPYFLGASAQEEDLIGAVLYLIIGLAVSIIVSQTQRARLRAEALSERLQFLANVSSILSSTLDYQVTLATLSQLIVPRLADWFVVDLIDAEGHFHLIEVGQKDPEKVRWARELRKRFPVDPTAPSGVAAVARTGKSELYTHITDEMLRPQARKGEEAAILQQLQLSSLMIVPLVAPGKTLGAATFIYGESGRRYTQQDLTLAEEVGHRAGLALENAQLYGEVQQARNQLEVILQGVADGIIVYGASNKIVYANEAAARLTGNPSVQALMDVPALSTLERYEIITEQGQPFPRSRLPHLRVFAGASEAQDVIGYRDVERNQPERWSLVNSRPVLNEQNEIALAVTIIHDITERTLTERRKDEFISMASHELKTPVTSLKGFSYVLQRRLKTHDDLQGIHYLDRMDAQLNRLARLISDLLDISRMQTGKLSFEKHPFDMNLVVSETLENLQAATSTHQLLLEGHADEQIFGDKDRIGQVLINLMTNAIKYSPEANRVIVRLSADPVRHEVIVSVQDFGIGIAEAFHQKIFERFYQVTDPQERTYPGLGMGLYISLEIVRRHRGRMWVESKKNEGATFFVALPFYRESVPMDIA